MKNWLAILEYYKFKNRTGPSIPFLIGTEEYLSGEKPEISKLLLELKESIKPIFIANCTTLNSLVVTLDKKMINSVAKTFKFGNLTVQAKELEWIECIEDLNNYLETIYMKVISNEKFSRRNQDWEEFNEEDKELIMTAINVALDLPTSNAASDGGA